ncbi:MAG: Sulfate permease, partial [uncultured Rubellimicrobium sp.]
VPLGDDRVRQRARHPDLHGPAARTRSVSRGSSDLPARRAEPCDHLPLPAPHESGPVAAGEHPRPDRTDAPHGPERAHGGGHGGTAGHAARVPASRRASHLRDAAHHLSFLRRRGGGRASGEPHDPESRGRAHRHLVQPRSECIGQGLANFATGFIGGKAGCAIIGQSM